MSAKKHQKWTVFQDLTSMYSSKLALKWILRHSIGKDKLSRNASLATYDISQYEVRYLDLLIHQYKLYQNEAMSDSDVVYCILY